MTTVHDLPAGQFSRRTLLVGGSALVTFPTLGQPAAAASKGLPSGVVVGFNARGTEGGVSQVEAVDRVFSTLPAAVVKTWVIRVTGGTIAQKTRPSDWSDELITAWINLQRKYGCRFVYVVNGTDTPESQASFIGLWRDRGAKFAFVEMMNEYYLARYRTGDTSFEEVTGVITADTYVNEILPKWLPAIEPLRVPIFVILAPGRQEGSGTGLKEWNDKVIAALVTGPLKNKRLGVTVHLYRRPNDKFDPSQIDSLRSRLPKGTPIAVTEAGINDAPDSATHAKATREHLSAIAARLRSGDFLLEQVLYRQNNADEATIGPDGITPKGKEVLALYTAQRARR